MDYGAAAAVAVHASSALLYVLSGLCAEAVERPLLGAALVLFLALGALATGAELERDGTEAWVAVAAGRTKKMVPAGPDGLGRPA